MLAISINVPGLCSACCMHGLTLASLPSKSGCLLYTDEKLEVKEPVRRWQPVSGSPGMEWRAVLET